MTIRSEEQAVNHFLKALAPVSGFEPSRRALAPGFGDLKNQSAFKPIPPVSVILKKTTGFKPSRRALAPGFGDLKNQSSFKPIPRFRRFKKSNRG
jgi:hypothetical protein